MHIKFFFFPTYVKMWQHRAEPGKSRAVRQCTAVSASLSSPSSQPGLPDWAINRELGYPSGLFETDFYAGRFANFWTTRNLDERNFGRTINVSSFVSHFV